MAAMESFTEEQLLAIIGNGEGGRVEFKERLSGDASQRIKMAICAFANDLPNHGQPGFVFVGVKDDGTIGDLPITDELLRQLGDMKSDGNIVPPPTMTVEKRKLDDKEVALVIVQPSDSPPVRYKGVIHVRTGSRRATATAQDESTLSEKRHHKDIPFDVTPLSATGQTDLSMVLFERWYLPNAVSPEILAANDRTTEQRLVATKMITPDKLEATVLGILTIGKKPRDHLPGAYIEFLRINGTKLTDRIVDEAEITGAIPDQLRELDDKLKAHNRVAVDFTTSSMEKRDATYPLVALQQITRNAVMHRTYQATNAPVRIYWYNDRIEIWSPGGPFGVVTPENFGQAQYTDYRNPNLAEAMRTFGFVQRFGIGIQIAKQKLEQAAHPPPKFEVDANRVLVTIYTRKQ